MMASFSDTKRNGIEEIHFRKERKRKMYVQKVLGLILLALCAVICAILPECGDVVLFLFPLGLFMLFTREIIIYGGERK